MESELKNRLWLITQEQNCRVDAVNVMWTTDDYSILDIPGPAFSIPDPAFSIPDPDFCIPDPAFFIPDPVFFIPVTAFFIPDPAFCIPDLAFSTGYGYILLLLIPNVFNLPFQVMSSPSSSAENSRSTGTVLNV